VAVSQRWLLYASKVVGGYALGNVLDLAQLRGHLDEEVRTSVEEDAQWLVGRGGGPAVPSRTIRTHSDCVDTRAGSYERKLQTKAGEA
jgi:putative transposase